MSEVVPANYNKQQSQMGLEETFNAFKKQIFLELNCHAIATIQNFNSADQTVTATMNYVKTYYQENDKFVMVPVTIQYPILLDCPLIILGGGKATLTFPISPGDECLVLFNDRDIDNWFAGSPPGPVATSRLHSFSDGLVLVGFPDIASYDTERALLSNGTTGVGVSSSKVKIYNSTTTLNTLLQQLVTDLTTFATGLNTGTLTAQATALVTALSSDATKIAALLE